MKILHVREYIHMNSQLISLSRNSINRQDNDYVGVVMFLLLFSGSPSALGNGV